MAPQIGDLVGKLEFTDDEIRDTQRGLDAAGINLPNFKTMNRHFEQNAQEERTPEPVETEDERIDRELSEVTNNVILLQALVNGAITRSSVRAMMEDLIDSKQQITELQSRSRAKWSRQFLQSSTKSIALYEEKITAVQSIIRGNRARKAINDMKNQRGQEEFSTKIQALTRRFLTKKRVEGHRKALHKHIDPIVCIQAQSRGYLCRQRVNEIELALSRHVRLTIGVQSQSRRYLQQIRAVAYTKEIDGNEDCVVALQACVRGCLRRRKLDLAMSDLHRETQSIEQLEAIARAKNVRRKLFKVNLVLESCHSELDDLKSRIRGSMVRSRLMANRLDMVEHEEALPRLQAHARRYLLKRQVFNTIENLTKAFNEVVQLQSEARGASARNRINTEHEQIIENEEQIIELQSRMRGVLGRFHYYRDLRAIDESEGEAVIPLQSLIRGNFVRDRSLLLIGRISKYTDELIELQSIIRGAIVRVDFRTLQNDLDDSPDSIVELQSLIKGFMVRKRFNERRQHFERNMDQVIKIQSFVRAKQQADAYKALTTGKNPPLATVKNFVHLLTDNDLDFEEEVEFEKLRKKVVDEVHQNEQLEQFIDQLDVKIALLVKNKISLDEVINHQRGAMPRTITGGSDPLDLKSLNKTSRRRLELYQGIFFVLQTRPLYLRNLFISIQKMSRVTEMELKTIESSIMSLFGYAQKRREEFLLLKLISRSLTDSADAYESLQDYVKSHDMWARLFTCYIRSVFFLLFFFLLVNHGHRANFALGAPRSGSICINCLPRLSMLLSRMRILIWRVIR